MVSFLIFIAGVGFHVIGIGQLVERGEYLAILSDPSRISEDDHLRGRAARCSFIAILAHAIGVALIFWSAL